MGLYLEWNESFINIYVDLYKGVTMWFLLTIVLFNRNCSVFINSVAGIKKLFILFLLREPPACHSIHTSFCKASSIAIEIHYIEIYYINHIVINQNFSKINNYAKVISDVKATKFIQCQYRSIPCTDFSITYIIVLGNHMGNLEAYYVYNHVSNLHWVICILLSKQ